MPQAHAHNPTTTPGDRATLTDLRERGDGEFIHVGEVAKLIGKTDRHLRRLCAEKLTSVGLARLIDDKWHIHRSFDPRLAHEHSDIAESSENAAERLKHYPEAKVIAAGKKATAIERYRALKADSRITMKTAVPSLIAELRKRPGVKCSYRTLRLWDAEAPHTRDRAELIEHFVDKRGGDQTSGTDTGTLDQRSWEYFCSLYMLPGHRLSLRHCWQMTRDKALEAGWSWTTYRHCTRVAEKRIPPSQRAYARHGEAQWDRKFGVRLQQQPDAWDAGELWIGDHTRLDFFVRDERGGKVKPVRLWLTAWTDWRTRQLVGWHIDWTPSSDTIRLAMHRAITRHGGPPKSIIIDHGKDYESQANIGMTKAEKRRITASGEDWREHVQGLFGLAGIDTHFSIPFNPDGKSRCERFFGTLHTRFCRTHESWCGSKPGEVDILKWVSKSPERLPSIDDVRCAFAKWTDWYNANADHFIADLEDEHGRRLSPDEAMRTWLTTKPVMPNPEIMAYFLMRWDKPVKVSNKLGVPIMIAGKRFYFGAGHPALEPLKGTDQKVRVAYDPEDLSHVYVYTADTFAFICLAQANGLYGGHDGASKERITEGLRLKREHRRAVKRSAELAHVSWMDPLQAGIEAQRRAEAERAESRRRDGVAPEPHPDDVTTRIVQTPIDSELKHIQQAEFRQAAGGEFSEFSEYAGDAGDAGEDDGDELDIGDLSDLTPFAFNNTSQPDADEDDDDDDDLDLETFTLTTTNTHQNQQPTDEHDGDEDDEDDIHPLDELAPFMHDGHGGPGGGLIE